MGQRFTSSEPLAPWLEESLAYQLEGRDGDEATPCRFEDEQPRSSWQPSATVGGGAGLFLDGDLTTRWSTGRSQAVGDRLRVVFRESVELSAVVLYAGPRVAEFPRRPVLELRDEAGRWQDPKLLNEGRERWRTVAALVEGAIDAPFAFRFSRQRATGVRITLAGTGRFTADWTVAELRAFGDCR